MSHGWASRGEKRTIVVNYQPDEQMLRYLHDMRDALRMALAHGYVMAREDHSRVPNPVALRRQLRGWFYSHYDYARHHINPVCRTAGALLRSNRKKDNYLAIPEVKRLAMRIDSELFKVEQMDDGSVSVRITFQPFKYEYIRFTPKHRKWDEYRKGEPSELLVTDRKLCFTFVVNEKEEKPLGSRLVASDLNFDTIDSTMASASGGALRLERVKTESIKRIARIQNDFSRRRRRLQLHVKNPQKRGQGSSGRQVVGRGIESRTLCTSSRLSR